MKNTTRIITTIVLIVAILLCTVWYFLVYDQDFTRDVLLTCARKSESSGNHAVAAWFYDLAYAQSGNSDAVAIELAQQYKASGNYTKAEYTLYNAIADGGGIDLYIALSKIYVEQDKLLDAVNMLNGVTNPNVAAQLNAMRPAAPSVSPDPEQDYSQYISVTLSSEEKVIYYSTDGQYPSAKASAYSTPFQLPGGETKVQALAVNDKGLVSQLATFAYTVADVIELVEFNDPAIEAAIREMLNVTPEKELYTNDLWTITEFVIPKEAKSYVDLPRLAFLEKLTISEGIDAELFNLVELSNLIELSITDTAVSQEVLNGIAQLPLQKLTLNGCSLSNIDALKSAYAITYLDLQNNAIRNINAISSMRGLQELYIQNNVVDDLTALASNSKLTVMDISHNKLTTLSAISSLNALTKLEAAYNQIIDLSNIGNLKSLTVLHLSDNNLTSIDQLANHASIEDLDISNNQLSNINKLASLTNLKYLDFSGNAVAELPAWDKKCSLVTIDGSNNGLSSLENLKGLKQLNVVNVEHNPLIDSVAPLASCPILTQVYVFGTAVTDVDLLKIQGVVVNFNPVQ